MATPKSRGNQVMSYGSSRDAYNPPVELPSSSASNFFEEAAAGPAEEAELRRKFNKFAKSEGDVEHLSFPEFTRLMEHYEASSPVNLVAYFYAMDRNRDHKLDFQEFFLGATAADPQTVHILNSFTGKERAMFTFDFYDTNRSGLLELEEFQRLVRDCAVSQLDEPAARVAVLEKAKELGLMSDRRGRHSDESLFIPPNPAQFYEFIQSERLRGTSRLFRFGKTLIKQPRSQRRHTEREKSSGHVLQPTGEDATTEEPASDLEDCDFSPQLFSFESENSPRSPAQDTAALPPYTALLPPAPPNELHLDTEKGLSEAFDIAARITKGLKHPEFEGLAPPGDGSFTLATADEICALCNAAVVKMQDEDMVVTNLQPPLKVFGALHGQIWDLLSHFKWHFPPVEDCEGDLLYMTYLFLGDYADRGSFGLEVLTLLLALKVTHPKKIAMLRGHHENRHVNYHLGLREECEQRLGSSGMEVYEQFNRMFEYMSLAVLVGGKTLALGPGILPNSLARLDQLKRYKKPLQLPHPLQQRHSDKAERLNEQVLLELFTPSELLPPELGCGSEREGEQVKAFCTTQKLNAVVASRQIPPSGFAFDFGNRLVRVCSCLNYCDLPGGNMAAILYIILNDDSECAASIRPKVLAAYFDRRHFFHGRPLKGRRSAPSRWPPQKRAPTPGRLREAQVDETGRPTLAVHLLEDQAVATIEENYLHFPACAPRRVARAQPGPAESGLKPVSSRQPRES